MMGSLVFLTTQVITVEECNPTKHPTLKHTIDGYECEREISTIVTHYLEDKLYWAPSTLKLVT